MSVSPIRKCDEVDATDSFPEVTVVIPTLASGSTLRRCLESVSQSSYPCRKTELIIVDGGSRDDSVQIAGSFGAKVLFRPGTSRGGACNEGVREAAGEFVAMTDSDAVVTSEWLSRIVSEMLADDSLVAIGGPDLGSAGESTVGKSGTAIDLFRRRKQEEGWKAVFKIKGVNSAYRRQAFLEVGGFDEFLLFGEESELHARIVALGRKIKYLPALVVYHRRHLQTWRSLGRSFRTSRRTAPLLLRPWTLRAALHDPTSSLATLLFLVLAMSLALPTFALALVRGNLDVLVGLAVSYMSACVVYSTIVVRKTESAVGLSLFLVTVTILAVQSILRGLGATLGLFEALYKWKMSEH